jgi:hypothetical protein
MDFDHHTKSAAGFHRRWMCLPETKRRWLERVVALNASMLWARHGAINQRADAARCINCLAKLEVASTIG